MSKNFFLFRRFFASLVGFACLLLAYMPTHAAQVDVLIVYDSETNSYYNGSPNTAIRGMVDQANSYLSNSRVDIQLNIVGTQQIGLPDNLSTLRNDSQVANLRDSTGADFVTYIVGSSDDYCGVGYLTTSASNAYNIVARGCMARSYLHEMGHNMGLGHSVAQGSKGRDYDYGVGYGVNNVFSTVMAYQDAYNSPQRTFLLSNPDYQCSGRTCGIENVADAARALNNVRDKVSNHRQSAATSQYVSMRKQNSSGFALDGNWGGANGQNVYLWSFNSSNENQHWEEINRGGGYYSYQKRDTNYCLDGGNGGADAQNLYLWTCSTNNQNQHWRKVDLGGKYRLEKRNAPGYSIDANGGGEDGQNVYLWRSNDNNQNQQFIFSNHN